MIFLRIRKARTRIHLLLVFAPVCLIGAATPLEGISAQNAVSEQPGSRVVALATNRSQNGDGFTTASFSTDAAASLTVAIVTTEQTGNGSYRIQPLRLEDLSHKFPAGRPLLLYVHGFNNTVDSALELAADVAVKMNFDGSVLVFAWPSRGSFLPRDYRADIVSAEKSTRFLEQLITSIVAQPNRGDIHVLAHSLGNGLLIKALANVQPALSQMKSRLGEVIFCSPDVERDEFKREVSKLRAWVRGATLWVSNSDLALQLAQGAGRHNRAGLTTGSGPLILAGVDTIDVSNETRWFQLNHNAYRQVSGLFEDMAQLIGPDRKEPWRDPTKSRNYQAKGTPLATYWAYFR